MYHTGNETASLYERFANVRLQYHTRALGDLTWNCLDGNKKEEEGNIWLTQQLTAVFPPLVIVKWLLWDRKDADVASTLYMTYTIPTWRDDFRRVFPSIYLEKVFAVCIAVIGY